MDFLKYHHKYFSFVLLALHNKQILTKATGNIFSICYTVFAEFSGNIKINKYAMK